MDAQPYPIIGLCEKADDLASASTKTPPWARHSAAAMREKWRNFAKMVYEPDATAAAGPEVRLGSWLTSALARAGRELSRAILGSPRDQRTAEEGLPQWPLANEACLTRYII